MGRFYAKLDVLYLTGKFYAVYIGVLSLVIAIIHMVNQFDSYNI